LPWLDEFSDGVDGPDDAIHMLGCPGKGLEAPVGVV